MTTDGKIWALMYAFLALVLIEFWMIIILFLFSQS